MLDSRFRAVAMVLKAWNKTLSADKNSRLNSFSICLLLLGFMLHKKYLPNLQELATVARGEEVVTWVDTKKEFSGNRMAQTSNYQQQ